MLTKTEPDMPKAGQPADHVSQTGRVVGPDDSFEVADLGWARQGRNEIRLAEHEMPGLIVLRDRYGDQQPLAGAK